MTQWLRDSDPARRPEWDLSHLRTGAAALAALALVMVPVAWGWRGALSALWVVVGLVLVGAFFSIGAWLVAKAGAVDAQLTLPVALATYVIKVVALGAVLLAVRGRDWVDETALAWSVVAGIAAWVGSHIWRVWHGPHYYVDPAIVDRPRGDRGPAAGELSGPGAPP